MAHVKLSQFKAMPEFNAAFDPAQIYHDLHKELLIGLVRRTTVR
jgi:hypothetical protein